MVPTLILLDEYGNVLRPSIQQNDARSVEEIEYFRQQTDADDILERTGSAVTQQSIGPKLLWLRKHEPEVMDRAKHVLGSYDYIVYRMTGTRSSESNWALESGLFTRDRSWEPLLLELSTIPSDWFGNVHQPSERVGGLTTEAACHLGLAEGTPVVAGSADHIASAFSAGIKEPGDLLVKLGGAGDILYAVDDWVVDRRLFLDYHVVPGKFLINGCMATSGSIIKWFRQNFAKGARYEALDEEGGQVPTGCEGLIVLPYFLGEKTPIHDPLARGVLFGLNLGHTRGHVYRAILEGISFGFLHHLEVLSDLGLDVTKVRVTNGGARSQLWKQVTADVIGHPLEQIAAHPGSSLGAAFVAGVGVGVFEDWAEIERFIKVSGVVEPNMNAHQTYLRLYRIYRALYDSVRDKFPILRDTV
jgi:xylulokinase